MNRQSPWHRLAPWISTPILVVVLIFVWEAIVKILNLSELTLPRPHLVWDALVELVTSKGTWEHLRVTLSEIVAGFALALVTGVVMGAVLGKVVWLERSLSPLIVAFQVIPKVALVPLLVIWFGFGLTSKVIMAAVLAFFPIMLNVLLGVRSVDSGHRDVMRSLNARRLDTFWHLEFKSTLPYVFAGMEVGIVLATIGAIVGEFLGGSVGLGAQTVVAMNSFNAPRLFAILVILAALGFALYLAVSAVKRLVIPWHESVRHLSGET